MIFTLFFVSLYITHMILQLFNSMKNASSLELTEGAYGAGMGKAIGIGMLLLCWRP